ncbi:MAG TPA: threonine/serine dehydratase [Candidatus Baltobacteraceae bacterium]
MRDLDSSENLRKAISEIEQRIRPYIRRTPVIEINPADFGVACSAIALKLELMQYAGSFKTRGAFTNLLLRDVPKAGIVAASGGNHGAAVAYAAMRLGIPATIFVPSISSQAKVDRIRSYGARLEIRGDLYADALAASEEFVRESGAMPVHAFDQAETIRGQGTLALELEQQAPNLDTVLAGVGVGGLISGIAAWYGGRTRVIGVEPRKSPTLTRAFEAGKPVDAEAGGIAADSLAPRRVGELVYPIARQYVERVLLVEDEMIEQAQQRLWDDLRLVAEPGGSAAFAALLAGVYTPSSDERVGVVVSGGNTVVTLRAVPQ